MDLKEACERLLRGEVLEEATIGNVYLWRFDPARGFGWYMAGEPDDVEWTMPSAKEASRMCVPAPKPRRWGNWEECAWDEAEEAGVWSTVVQRMAIFVAPDDEWYAVGKASPEPGYVPVRRVRGE